MGYSRSLLPLGYVSVCIFHASNFFARLGYAVLVEVGGGSTFSVDA